MVNTAEHIQKLRDEQTKHDQTRLQYDECLKSLVYKYVESTINCVVHYAVDKTVAIRRLLSFVLALIDITGGINLAF